MTAVNNKGTPTARIMVFEDDRMLRKLIVSRLERQGYEVLAFSEPLACPIYAEDRPCPHRDEACGDVLVTDNNMPRMTGLQLIEQQVRGGCKGAVKNKLIVTAGLDPEEQERARRLGCAVMLKPFTVSKLLEWVKERVEALPADRKLVALDKLLPPDPEAQ